MVPLFKVVLIGVYLLVLIILPIMFIVCVSRVSDANGAATDFANGGNAKLIFIPILVALGFHILFILVPVLFACERGLELIFMSILFTIALLEMFKYERRSIEPIDESHNRSLMTASEQEIGMQILIWMLQVIAFTTLCFLACNNM